MAGDLQAWPKCGQCGQCGLGRPEKGRRAAEKFRISILSGWDPHSLYHNPSFTPIRDIIFVRRLISFRRYSPGLPQGAVRTQVSWGNSNRWELPGKTGTDRDFFRPVYRSRKLAAWNGRKRNWLLLCADVLLYVLIGLVKVLTSPVLTTWHQ